jgi:MFS family permease
MKPGDLVKNKVLWLLIIMMVCSGASEQAVSQWASAFAEKGLGISKTAGDLAGPLTFAVMMGLARVIYGKFGERIPLDKFMSGSCMLCIGAYLLTALSSLPIFGIIGCALCGFSVGILWPGTFSRASSLLPKGGTAMFALLALSGDLGCSIGPSVVGFVSGAAEGNLKIGILAGIVFPTLLLCCIFVNKKLRKA